MRRGCFGKSEVDVFAARTEAGGRLEDEPSA